jgi:diadenosine tetraphosphatase ApaH/serine/threonine PP2A family protein phosphatase
MTTDDRVMHVRLRGFTDRQAAFLVTVMLHGGVCVRRQYATFAGVAHGRATCAFFEDLLADGYATARPCGHPRSRIFHVHHKALYRAIGEENSRYRRPTTLARAIERLMLLDGVVGARDIKWLATEADKVAYFTSHHRIAHHDLPSLTFRGERGETVRYFPEKLPIGLDGDGRTHMFLYLVTQDVPVDFRAFLERHAELWRLLPAWRIRLLVPRHKTDAIRLYERAFYEHLASPLRPSLVEDLRWYFRARRGAPYEDPERFDQAASAFGAPRFRTLYRMWLHHGETVLDGTLSSSLADALTRGAGACESSVLPHDYGHFYGLVATA